MQTNWTRRKFLGTAVVLIVGMMLCLNGCGKEKKKSAPTTTTVHVSYGSTVLAALQQATTITTRQHPSWGTEVIGVGTWTASKGTGQDDGFVVLVDGAAIGSTVDQSYLLTAGAHTIEVRHVPFGVHGKDGTTILIVTADVR